MWNRRTLVTTAVVYAMQRVPPRWGPVQWQVLRPYRRENREAVGSEGAVVTVAGDLLQFALANADARREIVVDVR